MSKPRIGICAGGGDCPGLNTVMVSIVKSLHHDYEILGFIKSFDGLLDKNYITLVPEHTSHLRATGGTILKSVNKGRFGGKVHDGKLAQLDQDLLKATFQSYKELGLEALIVMGGDGTLSTAQQMQEYGFNIVAVPKSIDNDLMSTDYTFGFHSAIDIVSESLDRLHTTASSHDRVMICEVMGRNAGWISLYGGLAGGANMILIPEIPFDLDSVISFLDKRAKRGRDSTVIVVAEGAKPLDGGAITKNEGGQSNELLYGGIGEYLAKYINTHSSYEARSTALGHIQRGGSPDAYDRIISTQFGAYAGRMIRNKNYGYMAALQGNNMTMVSLVDGVSELKMVDPDSQMVHLAKGLGISFGN